MSTPDGEHRRRPGDKLLTAGRPTARRALDAALSDEAIAVYVVEGRGRRGGRG